MVSDLVASLCMPGGGGTGSHEGHRLLWGVKMLLVARGRG